jgi:hypothetical protein
MLLVLAVAAVVSTGSLTVALLIVAMVGALAGVVVLGAARAGVVALTLAFATAPMYRGLEGLTGGLATPTDLLVVIATVLILPGLLSSRLQLPAAYVFGLVVVALTGLIASVISDQPLGSLFVLVQWLFFIGGLPMLIAWWRPGTRTIVGLLWAYVFGQVLSTAYALANGPVVGDRYQGLSHHTNAFGMAGMTGLAILMYLFAHHRGVHMQAVILGAAAVCGVSIIMSGSRAALAVAAVLVLIMPIIERSALSGFVLGIFGALALVSFPLLVQGGHGGSALTRLAGKGTAVTADQARTSALDEGLRRFWDSPILGSGLVDVELFHDIFLEVAVGIGIFGLVGYLIVLYMLTRPLLSMHVHRRLCYLPLAWIGMGPALPGMWDRTMWVPIGLAILASLPERPGEDSVPDEAPRALGVRTPPRVVGLEPAGPSSKRRARSALPDGA